MTDSKRLSSDSRDMKKLRKILHEEIRLGINAGSDSEEEEKVDLRKELYPLGHYINDREDMIEQMFSLIKGAKLRKMLPPILKDTPLDELKADCLIHLLGMSKKRIFAVLEGRQIDSSSDSESHSDSSGRNKKARSIVKPIVIKQEGCSDISDNPEEVVLIDPDSCGSSVSKTKRKSKKGEKRAKLHKTEKSKDVKKKKKIAKVENEAVHLIEEEQNKEGTNSENENEEVAAPTGGKNLLEILELEMRARAIRALLHKDGPKDGDGNNKDSGTKTSFNQDDPNNSAEDSDISEDNMVTPARNIRKRKMNSDDVIVVAPKLVTIDLTDEIESSIKNEAPQVTANVQVESANESVKSSVIESDKTDDKPSTSLQILESSIDINKDQPEDSNNRKSHDENNLTSDKNPDENSKEPEEKIPYDKEDDKDRETNDEPLNDKERELEEGEIVTNENEEDDHDIVEIPHENSEPDLEKNALNNDSQQKSGNFQQANNNIKNASNDSQQNSGNAQQISDNVQQMSNDVQITTLDVGEASPWCINEKELLKLAETVILSDDDSSMSEDIIEILEDDEPANSDEQQIAQSSEEFGNITKENNTKKNWAQRWLDSKEVKKVVSTSKLCGSIRKRIKIAKMAKKKLLEENKTENKDSTQPLPDIQGSVDEYQQLSKSITAIGSINDNNNKEIKTIQNEDSTLNIPTIDPVPENSVLNEQVQVVSSTDNVKIQVEPSASTLIESHSQITEHQSHVSQTDRDQVDSETKLNQTDPASMLLKTCDSSDTTKHNNAYTCGESLLSNDESGSTGKTLEIVEESNEAITDKIHCFGKDKIITPLGTIREENSHQPSEMCPPNEISSSENLSSKCLDDNNDRLQSLSTTMNNSQKTDSKESEVILDSDQNGPETLEINITDEELEIDGIINDIIDPSNESIVWSKSKIVEID